MESPNRRIKPRKFPVPIPGKARPAQQYRMGTLLGQGGFGKVYSGERLIDGHPVAVKHISKKTIRHYDVVNGVRVPREIALLLALVDVPHVVQLLDYIERDDSFLLIFDRPEPCQDFFDYISSKSFLTEAQARPLFAQLVVTVAQCHAAGVCHRDIKDENILISVDETGRQVLNLIDFGSGALVNENNKPYTDFDGTKVYCAPEYLKNRSYTAVPSTVWSLGILLYDMIYGNIPFHNDESILNHIIPLDARMPASREVLSLIQQCLHKEPSRRPTFDQILSHPWIKYPQYSLLLEKIQSRNQAEKICKMRKQREALEREEQRRLQREAEAKEEARQMMPPPASDARHSVSSSRHSTTGSSTSSSVSVPRSTSEASFCEVSSSLGSESSFEDVATLLQDAESTDIHSSNENLDASYQRTSADSNHHPSENKGRPSLPNKGVHIRQADTGALKNSLNACSSPRCRCRGANVSRGAW